MMVMFLIKIMLSNNLEWGICYLGQILPNPSTIASTILMLHPIGVTYGY